MRFLAVCTLLALSAMNAQAQAIYRIVGADGRVTFSDKPPVTPDKATVMGAGGSPAGADAGSTGTLPFDLRQVVNRYPVTLYTAENCVSCNAGRSLLSNRGIPFTERTINTVEDSAALQRLSGGNSLPFLTIGGQQLKGYAELEWIDYLDAAGYPKTPQLPAGYRNPAPTPLVAVQKPDTAPAQAEERQINRANGAPAVRPPAVNPANPAGIVF